MSDPIEDSRAKVREYLKLSVGDSAPEFRVVFSTNGSDGPTGIASVCTDPDHFEDDKAEMYPCCPGMDIECHSTAVAEYLVALINADRIADESPLSKYYEHSKCGFRWHGRDGMDIPMRDGQPVCPRCELLRVADGAAGLPEPVRYPYSDGDNTVLGPEIFATAGGDVLGWKGENYVRQPGPASDDVEQGEYGCPSCLQSIAVGRRAEHECSESEDTQ